METHLLWLKSHLHEMILGFVIHMQVMTQLLSIYLYTYIQEVAQG